MYDLTKVNVELKIKEDFSITLECDLHELLPDIIYLQSNDLKEDSANEHKKYTLYYYPML